MKTINEILSQEPVFLNDWFLEGKGQVAHDFSEYECDEDYNRIIDKNILNTNINILFASYSYENYSGNAWVLFEKNGELYEVNGSHCSCYGLEGQWCPEKVLLAELEHRLLKGTFGEDGWSDNNFKEELCEYLGVEYDENLEKYLY